MGLEISNIITSSYQPNTTASQFLQMLETVIPESAVISPQSTVYDTDYEHLWLLRTIRDCYVDLLGMDSIEIKSYKSPSVVSASNTIMSWFWVNLPNGGSLFCCAQRELTLIQCVTIGVSREPANDSWVPEFVSTGIDGVSLNSAKPKYKLPDSVTGKYFNFAVDSGTSNQLVIQDKIQFNVQTLLNTEPFYAGVLISDAGKTKTGCTLSGYCLELATDDNYSEDKSKFKAISVDTKRVISNLSSTNQGYSTMIEQSCCGIKSDVILACFGSPFFHSRQNTSTEIISSPIILCEPASGSSPNTNEHPSVPIGYMSQDFLLHAENTASLAKVGSVYEDSNSNVYLCVELSASNHLALFIKWKDETPNVYSYESSASVVSEDDGEGAGGGN